MRWALLRHRRSTNCKINLQNQYSITCNASEPIQRIESIDYCENSSSLRWFAMCPFNVPECENVEPHTEQANGLSPVCVRICVRMLHSCANDRPHTGQVSGFSTECMLTRWRSTCWRLLKRFGQSGQACGRSARWVIRTCVWRAPASLNSLPHSLQR